MNPLAPEHVPDRAPDAVETASRRTLWIVAAVSVLFAAFYQLPVLLDPYKVDDDALVMAFTWRASDPGLFPDDLMADIPSRWSAPGMSRLYEAAVRVVPLLLFSKLLPILEMAAAGFCLYWFAVRARWKTSAAWTVWLLFFLVCRTDQFYTGSWRGAAPPVAAAFLLCLQAEVWWGVAALLVTSVAFYPPLVPVLAGAAILGTARDMLHADSGARNRLLVRAGLLVAGGAALAAFGLRSFQSSVSYSQLAYEDILSRPEFGPAGRLPVSGVVDSSLSNIFSLDFVHRMIFQAHTDLPAGSRPCVLLLLAVIPAAAGWRYLVSHGRHVRAKFLATAAVLAPPLLMAAGVLLSPLEPFPASLYALAAVCVFGLMTAGRSCAAGTGPALLLLTAGTAFAALVFVSHRWLGLALYTAVHQLKYVWPLALCLLGGRMVSSLSDESGFIWPGGFPYLFAGVVAAVTFAGPVWDYSECRDTGLYSAASELPADAVLAGHPEAGDCLPVYARRSPLVMHECSSPLLGHDWPEIEDRTRKTFAALYASGPDEIRPLCESWPKAYLFVLDRYYEPQYLRQPHPYFEPFGAELKKYGAVTPWLRSLPPEYVIQSWDGGRLTSCAKLFPAAPGTVP